MSEETRFKISEQNIIKEIISILKSGRINSYNNITWEEALNFIGGEQTKMSFIRQGLEVYLLKEITSVISFVSLPVEPEKFFDTKEQPLLNNSNLNNLLKLISLLNIFDTYVASKKDMTNITTNEYIPITEFLRTQLKPSY